MQSQWQPKQLWLKNVNRIPKMSVLVQVLGEVQAQQQPTDICPSVILLQEQGEAPGTQKLTWWIGDRHKDCQMERKKQKY